MNTQFLKFKVLDRANKNISLFLMMLIGLVCMTCPVFAQEYVLSGTLINPSSNSFVAFANVGIKNASVGTVSNETGEFELHFDAKYLHDTLQVSCIGFFTYQTPLKSLYQKQPVQLSILPRSYSLKEVTVTPDEISAEYIVNKAMFLIPENYLNHSYLTDGFYREYFSENGNFVGFAEACVSIFDPIGYATNINKPSETIKINQLRVSDIYNKGNYVLYIDLNFALRSNLLRNANFWQNYAGQLKPSVSHLKLDSIAYYDNDLVYCISYRIDTKRAGIYNGRLFIRKTDYAVLRLELSVQNEIEGREENGAPHTSTTIMTFKEFQGKLYLQYTKASHEVSYQADHEQYDLTFYSELFITNLQPMNISPLPENGRIKPASIFYQPRYRTFDPDFWKSYNMFEKSPHNRQIIADLEQIRPLSEQYTANGKLKLKHPEPVSSNSGKIEPEFRTGF
ncbi:MAG: carboxypeptidase-like regulatory domain-containing protein [Sphingobacteriales bacterium]|nr:MAG: carboxypeptidase-like regulatory domain-containing protein [Sphingobacteriales bacterium]